MNLLGQTVKPPNNPGTWIGKVWRALVCSRLTMLQNPRIIAPVPDGNGIYFPKDAVIEMSEDGWTVMLPPYPKNIGGGGGGTSNPIREYDPTKLYTDGDEVLVSPNNAAVTTGVTDPDSGVLVKAIPGIYQFVSQNPSMVAAAGATPAQYHIPCWPPPLSSSTSVYAGGNYPNFSSDATIAAGKIYWMLIQAYPWPLCTKDGSGNSAPRMVNAGAIPSTANDA